MKVLVARNMRSILYLSVGLAILASVVTQLSTQAANTLSGVNELVTVNNVDGQGGNGGSNAVAISSDGNTILFGTSATNLSTSGSGLYVRNMKTGTNTRIDVSTAGVASNAGFVGAVMSETGRYVAFRSMATNLIDGQTVSVGQTYIRDVQAATTTVITGASPSSYYGSTSTHPDQQDYLTGVSNDGRFVSMDSKAISNNLLGAPVGSYHIVVYDKQTNTWQLIDNPPSGTFQYATHSFNSAMNCDGSFVVFRTNANNLIAGQSGGGIMLADLRNGMKLTRLTSGALGLFPKISCNGNYVIYATPKNINEINPTPPGLASNSGQQLIQLNRITGEKQYISSNSAGTIFNGDLTPDYYGGYIMPLDKFVATVSDAGDATFAWGSPVPYGGVYKRYNYLKHISDGSGTLEDVRKTPSGTYLPQQVSSGNPRVVLSANGKYIAYVSDASVLGLTTSPSGFNDVIRTKTGLD